MIDWTPTYRMFVSQVVHSMPVAQLTRQLTDASLLIANSKSRTGQGTDRTAPVRAEC